MERLCSWPSWISARARSHSRLGLEGHMGHLIANALARPFLHLLIPSRRPRRESQLWLSGSARAVPSEPPSLARPIWPATGRQGAAAIPLVNLSVFILGCCLCDACLIAALLRQHGPGNPCQLVGEGRSQNVRMQALSSTNEPGAETVLRPVRRPQQNDP